MNVLKMHFTEGNKEGFWGTVDASMDWCEANYIVTNYIAEFWNSLSSIPLILMGILGVVLTYKFASRERRFLIAFFCLGLVGFGSFCFHATLRQYAQFADELPMVWGNFAFFFSMLDAERPKAKHAGSSFSLLSVFVICAAVGSTIVYVATPWYFIFLLSYGGVTAFCFVYTIVKARKMDKLTKQLVAISLSSYAIGFFLWVLEHIFCSSVRPFQLHAWWHLFSGFGSYVWIMISVLMRAKAVKKQAHVLQAIQVMPYIVYADDKSSSTPPTAAALVSASLSIKKNQAPLLLTVPFEDPHALKAA
eukprot:TRINITY_DN912_c0_g1_i1.p1 TRINITY_DN912_c0_g1~~TRINITY_DN912_c0_g1_i1.p1  ORF type:complete len:305 (-),score=60.06 TRINITY_DN912_c0_g1_i1:295-1209(-)